MVCGQNLTEQVDIFRGCYAGKGDKLHFFLFAFFAVECEFFPSISLSHLITKDLERC
jgi:hypothetical protein